MKSFSLTKFAWISIGAAVLTITLKAIAYWLTGSVGLLSDALESVVNLVAAVIALAALHVAERPADEYHAYGYSKAEYFSSIIEGILIIVAAISIGITAVDRLIYPTAIRQVFLGLAISAIASVVNFAVARQLFNVGKKYRSITLEADAQHLMTDVWTSMGVIIGVSVVAVTNIGFLDPVIAIIVALNIVISGFTLMKRSALGFLDVAIPKDELNTVEEILDKYCKSGVAYHGIRTRQSGSRRFLSVHILVPGVWSVRKGHNLAENIEKEIRRKLTKTTVLTHIEPVEDPISMEDIPIDRE